MLNESLELLYDKVDILLQQCESLEQTNHRLLQREQQWQKERAQLIGKNELARTQIRSLISHLKKMQRNSI